MIRSLVFLVAALAGLSAIAGGALADQAVPALTTVHSVDEALHRSGTPSGSTLTSAALAPPSK